MPGPVVTEQTEARESAVRGSLPRYYRAIVLGCLLVPVNIFILLYMEVGFRSSSSWGAGPYPSTLSLFANTILFLVILTLLNNLIARRYPQTALVRGELMVIYVMLTISTAIVSIDFLDVLVPMISHPFRFATPENKWEQIIQPHIPAWISMRDPEALKAWYEGNSTLYTWNHIRPWIMPVSVWSMVILIMLGVMICINTIVRQQWIQNEKLLFPIVELPLHITDPGNRLLKSRLMWVGFGIAAGIQVLNGLHEFYPSIPIIPVKMQDISPMFTTSPWNAIGWTPVSFYPYGIGLGFLLPVDMLFSCWFFFMMWRVIRVLGAVYGLYNATPSFPYMNQQALGSYYMIAVLALLSGRGHLRKVMRVVLGREKDPDEKNGPMSYRTAMIGIFAGMLALVWFFHFLNLAWWMAVAVIGMYFLLAFAIAKMHAEFGPPAHDLHMMGPELALTGAMGSQAFTPAELTGLSWLFWFNRAYRSMPIAFQLDGLKIGHKTGISGRYMATAMALASVIAVVSGFWIYISFGYQKGASAGMAAFVPGFGVEAFGRLQTWINMPTKPDIPATAGIGVGMLFTWFLYMIRLRVGWWPWHPLGFAISTSYSIGTLWLPLMIAWAAKVIIFRFGGLKAYITARDFFLGLLLGDFLVGCTWPILGAILKVSTYSFMQ
ncbi:MAG: DUF6785 family protein [Armatimonadota bacterium]